MEKMAPFWEKKWSHSNEKPVPFQESDVRKSTKSFSKTVFSGFCPCPAPSHSLAKFTLNWLSLYPWESFLLLHALICCARSLSLANFPLPLCCLICAPKAMLPHWSLYTMLLALAELPLPLHVLKIGPLLSFIWTSNMQGDNADSDDLLTNLYTTSRQGWFNDNLYTICRRQSWLTQWLYEEPKMHLLQQVWRTLKHTAFFPFIVIYRQGFDDRIKSF